MPDEFLDAHSLTGPEQRIRQRWKAWEDCGATALTIHTQQREAYRLMAELAGCEPRG